MYQKVRFSWPFLCFLGRCGGAPLLSGGELQKVVIARALAQEPRILLLDEPISHLDMRNQMETMDLIREITTRLNIITIAVLHDLSCALRFSDRFVLLWKGRLHSWGDMSVMTPETVREVFGMDTVITEINGIPAVLPVAACKRGGYLTI